MNENINNQLRFVIVNSSLSNEDKTELLEYLEELIEKTSMYDGLCD